MGGLGRETLDLAYYINSKTHKYERIIFIDDFTDIKSYQYLTDSIEVLSYSKFHKQYKENVEITIAQGMPKYRQDIYKSIAQCYPLASLIHPNATISPSAKISHGAIVFQYATISTNTILGKNILVLPNANITHDCMIGSHSVLSYGTTICGNVVLGESVYIAPHSVIRERIQIGGNAIIGMGSVVLRNIEKNQVAYGNPAKIQHNPIKTLFRHQDKWGGGYNNQITTIPSLYLHSTYYTSHKDIV